MDEIYLLTDGCFWEINKQIGNEHPHSMEVVNLKTGAVRYITSGSRIKFVEGEITDIRTQAGYNKIKREMSSDGQDTVQGTASKEKSGQKSKHQATSL